MTSYGIPAFRGFAATFRIPGNAATALQNLLTIESNASGPLVIVREIIAQHDSEEALVSAALQVRLVRATAALPTVGTVMDKRGVHPDAPASHAGVVVRGGASADGVASAITATAVAGSPIRQAFGSRMHTAVGERSAPERSLVPGKYGLLVPRNASIIVQAVDVDAAAIPATNHWIVNVVWEEMAT